LRERDIVDQTDPLEAFDLVLDDGVVESAGAQQALELAPRVGATREGVQRDVLGPDALGLGIGCGVVEFVGGAVRRRLHARQVRDRGEPLLVGPLHLYSPEATATGNSSRSSSRLGTA